MFRKTLQRMADGVRRWMWGRNGVDTFNLFLLFLAVGLSLVGNILSRLGPVCTLVGVLVLLVSYGTLVYYLFRCLSKNLEARQREERRFRTWWTRISDRQNRYYRCPNCKQTVRVPRGRGKICIKCPKCCEKFIRKS